ncbi:hypothetical protein EBS43_12445 [bacterium]|jgi:glycerol-3-phosphate acyltransferase PlsY|nr:hypothetical protein [bacterium]
MMKEDSMKRTAEAKVTHLFTGVPVRLHFRTDLHLFRKVWHMVMGLVIVFCYMAGISRGLGVLILGSALGADLLVENLRLRSPAFNEKIMRFWAPLMRAHESNSLSTIPHYLASNILAIAIFPKPVAILSILYLACGDPIASLFGILYGHKGPRFSSGKSWIGTFAGVMVCTLVTFIYLKTLAISGFSLLFVTLCGGLAGGMAELLPFDVDDNFIIPVVSGFVLWLAFMIAGI